MGTSIDDGGYIGMMRARRDAGGLMAMTRVFCELSGGAPRVFSKCTGEGQEHESWAGAPAMVEGSPEDGGQTL